MSGRSQASSGSTGDWVLGAIKKNPEGLLLLAAGAALLLRKTSLSGGAPTGRSRSRRSGKAEDGRLARMAEGAKEYVSEAKDYASDIAGKTKEAAQSYASAAADYAGEAGQAMAERSEEMFEEVRSTAQDTIGRIVQEQPLLVALAGLAAGAAIAAAFPATDMERETLGRFGEQVNEAAGRIGERLREATADAADRLKDVVHERGLDPDGMKDVAKEVADAFSDSISGGSREGGDSAKRGGGSAT